MRAASLRSDRLCPKGIDHANFSELTATISYFGAVPPVSAESGNGVQPAGCYTERHGHGTYRASTVSKEMDVMTEHVALTLHIE